MQKHQDLLFWGQIAECHRTAKISGSQPLIRISQRNCENTTCWAPPQSFSFRGCGQGWEICISDKVPGDADIAGLVTTHWEPLITMMRPSSQAGDKNRYYSGNRWTISGMRIKSVQTVPDVPGESGEFITPSWKPLIWSNYLWERWGQHHPFRSVVLKPCMYRNHLKRLLKHGL